MSVNIRIEKGVPVPVKCKTKYPLLEMEVGDSFFVAIKDTKQAYNEQAFVCADARRLRDRVNPSLRYTTRKVEGGIRVWRIA